MESQQLERRRIVVDGSNIATEGRSQPSLAQLDEAIRSFLEEYPGFTTSDVIVVVDATFGHRIDPSEAPAFEQAVEHGEMVTPPAGAIGRGDGFILRIADKSGALVLSNDSFQEFHAERPWLFEPGRLIGGKPVPGIGWVFTPRTPVRGPVSRSVTTVSKRGATAGRATAVKAAKSPVKASEAVKAPKTAKAPKVAKAAKPRKVTKPGRSSKSTETAVVAKARRVAKEAASTKAARATKVTKAAKAKKTAKRTKAAQAADGATAAGGAVKTGEAGRVAKATKSVTKAVAKATRMAKPTARTTKSSPGDGSTDVTARADGASKGSAERGGVAGQQGRAPERESSSTNTDQNDALTFLTFVAEHPVGSTFGGTVAAFTSHGASVEVDGMRCHVPLRGLGDPPPTRARQVLTKGETRTFVLVSLDARRRRASLALAGAGAGADKPS